VQGTRLRSSAADPADAATASEAIVKARSFFYVCCGIFLLALAYHLGARSATAQGGLASVGEVQFDYGYTPWVAAVQGRILYLAQCDINPGPITDLHSSIPVPGTSPIIATNPAFGYPIVLLENGDVYRMDDVSTWTLKGNVFNGPTPATRETWGGVKARYRPGVSSTPEGK